MAKVMPSALGFVSCKLKSVVKLCTFTGVVNHALPASDCPPSVNSRRVPFSLVRPLNCKPVAEKPELKLMEVAPPPWMVITELAAALCAKLGAVAIAFTVVVALTLKDPVYRVEEVVGWLPSSV